MNATGTWVFKFFAVALGASNGEVDMWRFFNNTTTDNCGRGQGLTVFDSAEGSRNVSRFNSYTNNNQTTHGTETGAGGARGLRKIEIYNNTFTYTFDSW